MQPCKHAFSSAAHISLHARLDTSANAPQPNFAQTRGLGRAIPNHFRFGYGILTTSDRQCPSTHRTRRTQSCRNPQTSLLTQTRAKPVPAGPAGQHVLGECTHLGNTPGVDTDSPADPVDPAATSTTKSISRLSTLNNSETSLGAGLYKWKPHAGRPCLEMHRMSP